MAKFNVTYRKNISLEYARKVVSEYCVKVRCGNTSSDMLKRLCGSISYCSMSLIPDFDLEVGVSYSIENICYFAPGIMKLPLHIIVDCLGNIAAVNDDIRGNLKTILHECLFGEIMCLFKLNPKYVYCALFYMYSNLFGDENMCNNVLQMWDDSTVTLHHVWDYFESEVYENG